jgi:hypothetical protein
MPKRKYEHREPTHEWSQIRPLLKDSAQIKYELVRPVILWGVNANERVAETGEPRSTIYYQAKLFDKAGMASLLPPEPPPVPSSINGHSYLRCAKPLWICIQNVLSIGPFIERACL